MTKVSNAPVSATAVRLPLRHKDFAGVDEVSGAIKPRFEQVNRKCIRKLQGSRANAFPDLAAPASQAPQLQPWEWTAFKSVRMHIKLHGDQHTRPEFEPRSRRVKRSSAKCRTTTVAYSATCMRCLELRFPTSSSNQTPA